MLYDVIDSNKLLFGVAAINGGAMAFACVAFRRVHSAMVIGQAWCHCNCWRQRKSRTTNEQPLSAKVQRNPRRQTPNQKDLLIYEVIEKRVDLILILLGRNRNAHNYTQCQWNPINRFFFSFGPGPIGITARSNADLNRARPGQQHLNRIKMLQIKFTQ